MSARARSRRERVEDLIEIGYSQRTSRTASHRDKGTDGALMLSVELRADLGVHGLQPATVVIAVASDEDEEQCIDIYASDVDRLLETMQAAVFIARRDGVLPPRAVRS